MRKAIWISPENPPLVEDPVLGAFIDRSGIRYTAIGWYNISTHRWSDNIASGMERATRCIGWMELPEPPKEG